MRFISRTTLSAIVFLAAAAAQAFAEPGPDSIVVERLFAGRPVATAHHVPLRKFKEMGPGTLLDSVFARLRQNDYFTLTSATVAEACGNPGDKVAAWSIRLRESGAWRELLIPDGCTPTAPLNRPLSGLRALGSDLFSGRLR